MRTTLNGKLRSCGGSHLKLQQSGISFHPKKGKSLENSRKASCVKVMLVLCDNFTSPELFVLHRVLVMQLRGPPSIASDVMHAEHRGAATAGRSLLKDIRTGMTRCRA